MKLHFGAWFLDEIYPSIAYWTENTAGVILDEITLSTSTFSQN